MKQIQSSKSHAILLAGVPGSGKTQFAEQFSETFNAPFIDADLVYAKVDDEAVTTDLTHYTLEQVARTRQTFLYEPRIGSRASRLEFAKWARSAGYEPLVVWVQVDAATSESRSRRAGRSREEYDALAKRFSAPHAQEKAIVISGKHTYASQAKALLTRLSNEAVADREPVGVPSRAVHAIDITRG